MTDIMTAPAVVKAMENGGSSDKQPIRAAIVRAAELARDAEEHARTRQHAKGKRTARERLDLLFDTGSFQEIGRFAGGNIKGARSAYTRRTSPCRAARSARPRARRSAT